MCDVTLGEGGSDFLTTYDRGGRGGGAKICQNRLAFFMDDPYYQYISIEYIFMDDPYYKYISAPYIPYQTHDVMFIFITNQRKLPNKFGLSVRIILLLQNYSTRNRGMCL